MAQFYNTIHTDLSREFLEEKVQISADHLDATRFAPIKGEGKYHIIEPTQVLETESGFLTGILWNMRGEFDGHYAFIVNPNTFEYSVKQHSYYGNFVCTTPARDTTVYTKENMTDAQIKIMDGCIANVLLLCTQYAEEDAFRILDVMSKRAQMLVFKEVKPDTF